MDTPELLDKLKKGWDSETTDLAKKYLDDIISFQEFYNSKKEMDFRYYAQLNKIIPNRNVSQTIEKWKQKKISK